MDSDANSSIRACDVLVIGGGPAGSTAAALLAKQGRDVILLERDEHPRFHIGESLLPKNLAIFEELGVAEEVASIGVFKPGAEFISEACGRRVGFPFRLGLTGNAPHAYQVRRADLDLILFRAAERHGATCWQRTKVTSVVDAEPGGRAAVQAQQDGRVIEFAPRFVLDASGRAGMLAARNRSRLSDKNNNSAAVFAHYTGVPASSVDREGYISVHLAQDGWFWTIPLPDGVTSVGFVGTQAAFKSRDGGMDNLLQQRIAMSPVLRERMKDATIVSPVHTEANYSYYADKAWGEGWFLVGDAFAFLDPVFSSGVLLAMTGAQEAATVTRAWLESRAEGIKAAMAAEKRLRAQMKGISWLIYRINNPVLRQMFMSPSNKFRMRDGLISILAGDLNPGARAGLAIVAFKAAFHTLNILDKLGVKMPQPPALARINEMKPA